MDRPLPPYPPMSHPVADPARNVVTALFAGLHAPDPSTSRILEIGCASGHHLLPLAMRWPQANCLGIDPSSSAIAMAKELALEAGLSERIDFQTTSLEDFDPGKERYDFIIAHGFFSWVDDRAKHHVLDFCSRHLTANGLAVVSFNVEAGWRARWPIIRKARALMDAGLADDHSQALHLLRVACDDPSQAAMIDDMLAKGQVILAHDDFGPVNDPWCLDRFVALAAEMGLRWLGESNVADNRPSPWSEADEIARSEQRSRSSPLQLHQWMDERCGRTFRSALLCRHDAPASGTLHLSDLSSISLRPVHPNPLSQDPLISTIHAVLMGSWPATRMAGEIITKLPEIDPIEVAKGIAGGMVSGEWHGLSEPRQIGLAPPSYPKLDALRLACARRRIPCVDAWHRPCVFTENQWPILSLMDGGMSRSELKSLAAEMSPSLDFLRFLEDLHQRGMFL